MQSGITASAELLSAFQGFVSDPSIRGLIAGIENEALVAQGTLFAAGTFEEDLTQLDEVLKDNVAAYILLRRYETGDAPFVAVIYVPDTANVRQKMLFASTRNTLLRELGTEKFRESIFATTKDELTAEGFQKHEAHSIKPAPLTEEEKTLQEVRRAEADAQHGTTARATSKQHLSVQFSEEAKQALIGLNSSNFITLVQLAVDMQKESIELASASSSVIGDFTKVISDDTPRYSFFVFKHTYEGVEESPIVFIYTCPPQAKIRERMLYAASRNIVVHIVEKELGLKIAKKLEAATPAEVGEEQLLEEFHPKKEAKGGFKRPQRPGRR